MNERLYELCAGLPDTERQRDRGAFFKSVHSTLNHLLYGDRAWMSRFTGRDLGWREPADELTYTRIDGRTRTLPAWLLVAHMFNHQTHHRGQLTTLLSQLGVDPGATDLPWLPGTSSAYFWERIHFTNVLTSASGTAAFGGIGTFPQTPWLPFLTLAASFVEASLSARYFAATSL
jgi:uncharacterized damage-inducible protein DinB